MDGGRSGAVRIRVPRVREPAYERTFRAWCDAEGVTIRTLRYARAGGGETNAYRMIPRRAPRGGVMMVHGAGNDALFSLTGLFRTLLGRGFEVFTFDVDGHGRRSSTRFSAENAADSIPAALERWERTEGLPVTAVGISLGGALLLHSLPALSRSLRSAVLVSAPLRVRLSRRAILRELGPRMLLTIWRERAHFGFTGLIPSFGPFRRGLYPLRLVEEPGPGAFGYVEQINRALEQLHLEEAARRSDLPVLLLYGEEDALVPPEQARVLAASLPRAELHLLRGETHLSTPLAPATVRRLLEWIEEGPE